jgi:hypothetical protein
MRGIVALLVNELLGLLGLSIAAFLCVDLVAVD